jgi:hypothetical protein
VLIGIPENGVCSDKCVQAGWRLTVCVKMFHLVRFLWLEVKMPGITRDLFSWHPVSTKPQ